MRSALGLALVLVGARIVGCSVHGLDEGLDEDAVLCEEAMSHLTDCCRGFSASHVSCASYDVYGGCSGDEKIGHVSPDISSADARCMLDKSCNELEAPCQAVLARAASTPTTTRMCQ